MSYSAVYGILRNDIDDDIDQALSTRKVKAQVVTIRKTGNMYAFVSCPINFSRPYPNLKFLCDFIVDAKYLRRISKGDMVDSRHTYLVGDRTKLDESAAQDLVEFSGSNYGQDAARMSGLTEVDGGSQDGYIRKPYLSGTKFIRRPQAPDPRQPLALPA